MEPQQKSVTEPEVNALLEALDDEYKAAVTYAQVIDDFGPIRPFVNIIEAERRHIEALRHPPHRHHRSLREPPTGLSRQPPPSLPAIHPTQPRRPRPPTLPPSSSKTSKESPGP